MGVRLCPPECSLSVHMIAHQSHKRKASVSVTHTPLSWHLSAGDSGRRREGWEGRQLPRTFMFFIFLG